MKRFIAIWIAALCTFAAAAQTNAGKTTLQDKMVSASLMANADISINPNPVVSTSFSLVMQNLEKGKYQVFLYDTSGRKYLLKTLEFEGGSAIQPIILPKEATVGVYILQVVSKAVRFSRKLTIQ
ncbi:MAG TPA: T9SS type A sorting domain-containing protein [Chitinophagaceae bacterium]